MAAMAHDGWEMTLAIATDGDRGSMDPQANRHLIATARREEARCAAQIIGLARVIFLGYEDGELYRATELRADITRLYRMYQPTRILTFDPWKRYELHPDHRAIGTAALDARLASRLPHFHSEQLRDGLKTWTPSEILLFNTDNADFFVDISATFGTKLQAVWAHTSQWEHIWDEACGGMKREAEATGERAGYTLAEGFKRIHVPLGPVSADWEETRRSEELDHAGCQDTDDSV